MSELIISDNRLMSIEEGKKLWAGWVACLVRIPPEVLEGRMEIGVDMAAAGESDETAVSEELRQAANYMLWELEDGRLDVSLGQAPEPQFPGHMVRIVNGQNPQWYKDLCAEYPSARRVRRGKFDTRIRRRSVIRALREIMNGRCSTLYAQRLLPYVAEQASREPESYWQDLFK